MFDLLALNNLTKPILEPSVHINQIKNHLLAQNYLIEKTVKFPNDYRLSLNLESVSAIRKVSNWYFTIKENSDGSFQLISKQPDWVREKRSYPLLYFVNNANGKKSNTEGKTLYINERIERDQLLKNDVEMSLWVVYPANILQWMPKRFKIATLKIKLAKVSVETTPLIFNGFSKLELLKDNEYQYKINQNGTIQLINTKSIKSTISILQNNLVHGKWVKNLINIFNLNTKSLLLKKAYLKNINLSNASDRLDLSVANNGEIITHTKLNEDFSKTLVGFQSNSNPGYILSPKQKEDMRPTLYLEFEYPNSAKKLIIENSFILKVPPPLIDGLNGQLKLYLNSTEVSNSSSNSVSEYTMLSKRNIAKIVKSNLSLDEIFDLAKYSGDYE